MYTTHHTNLERLMNRAEELELTPRQREELMLDLYDAWWHTEGTYSDLLACVARLKRKSMPAITNNDTILPYEIVTPRIKKNAKLVMRWAAKKQLHEVRHSIEAAEDFMYHVRMTVYYTEREVLGGSRMWYSIPENRGMLFKLVKENIRSYEEYIGRVSCWCDRN